MALNLCFARMHVMAGVIPDCQEADRQDMLKRMEETFVSNLQYAAGRLDKVKLVAVSIPAAWTKSLDL